MDFLFIFSVTGQEYTAVVEFAPFQKVAKKKNKKKDSKAGTIEEGMNVLGYSESVQKPIFFFSLAN